MTRPAFALLAAAACAVIAGCGPSSASVPPSRYLVCSDIVGPCAGVTPKHEPSSLLMSGDGSLYAKGLTWAGWGTATATGHGTAEVNDCTPYCAAGTYHAHPITITLSRPERWHQNMVYTSAAYSIPSLKLHETFTTGLMPGPVPSLPPPTAPPAPGPVSAQASVTGSCAAGYEAAYATASGGVAYGPFTAGQPTGYVTIGSTEYAATAAYELTLTNTGSTTAAVDGFVVAVYNSAGQELGSDAPA
jgi:hypothetical protein